MEVWEKSGAVQNATSAAEKYGGFVVSTSVSEDEDDPTGAIVVRVPAPRFGDGLSGMLLDELLGRRAHELSYQKKRESAL